MQVVDELLKKENAEEFFLTNHTPLIKNIFFGAVGTLLLYPHCTSFLPVTFLCAMSFAFFIFSLWSFTNVSKHPFGLFCVTLMLVEKYLIHHNLFLFEIFQVELHKYFSIKFTTHSSLQVLIFAAFLIFPFIKNKAKLQKSPINNNIKYDFAQITVLCFWLQLTFITAKNVPSYYDFSMSVLQISMLLFMFPIAYAWFLINIFKVLYLILGLQNIAYMFVLLCFAAILFKFSNFVQRKASSVLNTISSQPLLKIMLVLLALAAAFVSPLINNSIKNKTAPEVSIEQYSEICLSNSLLAADQLACRQLTGFLVEFEASIEYTSVTSVVNKVRRKKFYIKR